MQAVSRRTRESGKRPLLMSGLQGARCWRRTVTIDSEVRTLDHLNDVRHSHPSVIPASPPSFLHRLRHSCAASVIPAPPPSFLRPLRHSCVPSVIPAEAGIQAICAGQGHSQCSTAPDHPRGSGGPSAGWRLVARLGGRMDSCLRRNDGQGGCDGGGGGMTEGRWDPTCSEDAGQRPPRVETASRVGREPPTPRIAARRRRRSAAPRSRGCAWGPPVTDRGSARPDRRACRPQSSRLRDRGTSRRPS